MKEVNVKMVSATVTRATGNTTTYTPGDLVAGNTPAVIAFSDIVLSEGGSGSIEFASLVQDNYATVAGAFDLMLFDTTFGVDADNAAFTPTDAEMLTAIGVIQFLAANRASGNGNAITPGTLPTTSPLPFKCLAGSKTLYAALIARSGYVPADGEVFSLRLTVRQD